jgi:hypothetical protein
LFAFAANHDVIIANAEPMIAAFDHHGLARYCEAMLHIIDTGGRRHIQEDRRSWFADARTQALAGTGDTLLDLMVTILREAPISITLQAQDGTILGHMSCGQSSGLIKPRDRHTGLLCLLCSAPLMIESLDGETLGPLLCEAHDRAELHAGKILGADVTTCPVAEIAPHIKGRTIAAVRCHPKPRVLVLVLDNDAVLVAHLPYYASMEYFPGPVSARALAALTEVDDSHEPVAPVLKALREQLPILDLTHGVRTSNSPDTDVVTLHFPDAQLLDFDSDIDRWHDTSHRGQITVDWRPEWWPPKSP